MRPPLRRGDHGHDLLSRPGPSGEVSTVSSLAAGCACHAGGPSIARASADYSRHRDAWLADRRLGEARRRVVRAVDALVGTVEEINLSGRGTQPDPLIPHRVRRLDAEIGMPVPRQVHLAKK